jgi:hypothetical protein
VGFIGATIAQQQDPYRSSFAMARPSTVDNQGFSTFSHMPQTSPLVQPATGISSAAIAEGPSFRARCLCELSLRERAMAWHQAHLEYACCAPLSHVSLEHWDQDDTFAFSGEHSVGE